MTVEQRSTEKCICQIKSFLFEEDNAAISWEQGYVAAYASNLRSGCIYRESFDGNIVKVRFNFAVTSGISNADGIRDA